LVVQAILPELLPSRPRGSALFGVAIYFLGAAV